MGTSYAQGKNFTLGIRSETENTSAPLGIGGTWQGESELNGYPDILITCFTDAEGEILVEFSSDGINYDSSLTFTVTGNIHEFHVPLKGPRRVRLNYTNGDVAQSVFRLHTFYGTFRQGTAPLNLPYSLDSDAIVTRSPWTWLDVARGLAGGITSIKKFGRNDSVGQFFEPVALGGIYRTPQNSAATTLRIKAGGNANDNASGSGARSIVLTGLDDNNGLVSGVLATNGASASLSTTALFTRLFLMDVEGSGSYASSSVGSHVGDIVIENTAGTEDWGTIGATDIAKSGSEIGAYSIPRGKVGFVKLRDLSIDSGKTIDAIFFSREGADEVSPPYSPMRARSVITGVAGGSIEAFGQTDVPFGPFVGPTDVGFMAKVASGSAVVSVEFEIILIDA